MELKPLTLQDLQGLDKHCFSQPYSLDVWSSYLERPSRFPIFGFYEDSQLVGYACFSVITPEAELLRVGVLPELRGAGLAAAGLQVAQHNLETAGVERFMLEVRQSNQAAIKLYQKLGYINDGERPGYYPSDADGPAEAALLMSLDLN